MGTGRDVSPSYRVACIASSVSEFRKDEARVVLEKALTPKISRPGFDLKVISQSVADLGTSPGLEVKSEVRDGNKEAIMISRGYIVNRHFYQLIYVAEKKDLNEADAQKFFASFKINKAPTF